MTVVITTLHVIFILFMVIAPFTWNIPTLALHASSAITMMIHWVANSNMCFLTFVESKLRNVDCENSFIHKIVSPVYDINDGTIGGIVWILTIILFLVSIYKIIKISSDRESEKHGGDT